MVRLLGVEPLIEAVRRDHAAVVLQGVPEAVGFCERVGSRVDLHGVGGGGEGDAPFHRLELEGVAFTPARSGGEDRCGLRGRDVVARLEGGVGGGKGESQGGEVRLEGGGGEVEDVAAAHLCGGVGKAELAYGLTCV